jgi:uncharacterized protein YjeT (DUF2065 family)
MLKLLLVGIGLLLFFEGILYFFLAGNLNSIFEKLSKVDPQNIKTISLTMIIIGYLFHFKFLW